MKREVLMKRALLLTAAALACAGISLAQTKAFVGARVIDGTGKPAIEKATIVVRDGKIQAVGANVRPPAGAQVIDVAGKTIVPGFINAHGHVTDTKGLRSDPSSYTRDGILSQLGLYARYGVTTVYSLGGDGPEAFKVRDEQETTSLNRARIYVAGTIITGNTVEEVRKKTAEVVATKPDIIKVRVDDNLGSGRKMAPELYRAIIDEAHKGGKRVAIHMYYLDDAKDLVKSGTDVLAHSIRDKDVDAEMIGLIKKNNAFYIPTLTRDLSVFVYESTPKFFSDPFFLKEVDKSIVDQLNDPKRQAGYKSNKTAQAIKVAIEQAKRNVKLLSDGGVVIAMGTDSGPPARFQGYFEHLELEMMVEAGMSPMKAIVSATGDAARSMKSEARIGAIQPGRWADLIVLGANPLDDIRNTKKIESVWIAGNQVQR
jgi:imidazolonepropionase-like amidohydrolase